MSYSAPHTLVIASHVDPQSLTHHVATEAARIAGRWGTVEVGDLAAEGFDPRFSQHDRSAYLGQAPDHEEINHEHRRLDRATDLVLVFPVYWWSMPAQLKGWIDRVFVNGWAFDYEPSTGIRPRLQRLTIHLLPVAASGEALYERHGYEKALRTQIEHGIIDYCGSILGSSTFVYDSEDPSDEVRSQRVEKALSALRNSYRDRHASGAPALEFTR